MAATTRSELRLMLEKTLRSDSDLDAFVGDYFPQARSRFSSGMDRVQKVTLLLDYADPEALLSALRTDFPLDTEAAPSGPASRPLSKVLIADVFRTSGHPQHNFVEPAQAPELKMRLRVMGEGLLVEGPSGVGKTTAVEQALHELGQRGRTVWFSALSEKDRLLLDDLVRTDFSRGGYLVVDDFHRLDAARQSNLTSLIKVLSDRNRRDAKVTLIGVNPVGASLLNHFPDVFGRFAVVALGRQPDEKVDELVRKGEAAANLRFTRRQELATAADGSFAIAQRLCLEAAREAGIPDEVPHDLVEVTIGPERVLAKVHKDLAAKFRALLMAFASFDEAPPPRGACLLLLWHLKRSDVASVSLHDVRYRDGRLAGAFSWLMASNLAGCFAHNPGLVRLLHYDRYAGVLSADDPQLPFYLRHLDWSEFAKATGHSVERLDPLEGPVFRERRVDATAVPEGPTIGLLAARADAHAGLRGTLTDATPPAAANTPRSATILHLSDLHFGTPVDATLWHNQLASDLKYELSLTRLDAVIVSGDVADRAEPPEYQAAQRFFQELMSEFGLSPQQIVIVPGNHDVSWTLSEQAYTPVRRKSYKGALTPGMYIDNGDYIELRSEADYMKRLQPFGDFYEAVRLEPYPLDYQDQATVQHFPDAQVVILGLSSSWNIDHHFKARASIHPEALSRALQQIRNTPAYAPCLKLAVWHHALGGEGEDRLKDTGFLEQLAQAGFRLGLHGHVHKADNTLFRYHRQSQGGGIELLGAGTFGAPASQWVPGYPLQYQVLELTDHQVVVHTRRREEPNGAWKPDARWLQGPGKDPLPRYTIAL